MSMKQPLAAKLKNFKFGCNKKISSSDAEHFFFNFPFRKESKMTWMIFCFVHKF